jgi:predicted HicB family RNase H-like nuclease
MGRKKTGRISNVRIDSTLAHKAKVIAASNGVSMSEYISELLRDGIDREWPKVVKSVDERIDQ